MRKGIITHSKPTISIAQFLYLSKLYFARHFATGKPAAELGKNLCGFFNRQHCAVVNSGTSALHLLLKTLITSTDDKILLSGYSCYDIANAVLLAGGKPIFLDVDEEGQLKRECIAKHIDNHVKAIIILHNFGHPCVIPNLDEFNIRIIEDCTHSFKNYYEFSDVMVSLGATKFVSGVECGVVLTSRDEVHQRIQGYLTTTGEIRYPYRESDFHAGIALMQFKEINKYIKKRKAIAGFYYNKLSAVIDNSALPNMNGDFLPYRFVIKLRNKDECDQILQFCRERGVRCERPVIPHKDAFKIDGVRKVYERFLSMPIYPSLSFGNQRRVMKILIQYLAQHN